MTTKWRAIYKDGTFLDQIDKEGNENSYMDIDRENLSVFMLLKDDKIKIVLHLDDRKRLIYRRRVTKNLMSQDERVVHLVGYQEKKNGTNFQALHFYFEDEEIIETMDGFREDRALYSPVKFLPEEELSD